MAIRKSVLTSFRPAELSWPGLAMWRLAGAGACAGRVETGWCWGLLGCASQLSCFLLFLQVCWELAQARALGLLTSGG